MSRSGSSPDSREIRVQSLHLAVERNRISWRQMLQEGAAWDRLVLTASDEAQAEIYRHQLDRGLAEGLLLALSRIHVIPDPPGPSVGSGGATLNALRELGPTPGERVLLLHCGGESRRAPSFGPSGKLFTPLPRAGCDGRPSTLFHELLVSLTPLLARAAPGWLVAATDVLLLFDPESIHYPRGAVLGCGIRADLDTAIAHGVYLPNDDGSVRGFMQKPSRQKLLKAGGASPDGTALVDSGVLFFPEAVVDPLHAVSRNAAGREPSDLYDDWIFALLPETDRAAYLGAGNRPARGALWEALHGTPFALAAPGPARFVHLGTTRQWRDAITGDPRLWPPIPVFGAFLRRFIVREIDRHGPRRRSPCGGRSDDRRVGGCGVLPSGFRIPDR